MNPTKRQVANGTFRLIDGKWHKRCPGPAHEEPTYLPATTKYFHERKSGPRNGELVSRCRLCINWDKLKSPGSQHGYVPVKSVKHFYEEAVNRIGVAELARRAQVSEGHIQLILRGQQEQVRKVTFRKVMLELISIRRRGEYSISVGSHWRNQRRTHENYDLCGGCGTPKSNFTKGCDSCVDRWYRRYRLGEITREELDEMRAKD